MTVQTMKRLVAFKFQGVKVANLNVYGSFQTSITFECAESGRMFLVEGSKDITEIKA